VNENISHVEGLLSWTLPELIIGEYFNGPTDYRQLNEHQSFIPISNEYRIRKGNLRTHSSQHYTGQIIFPIPLDLDK